MSFFVDRSHLGSLPMTHMIMDEGEDSKGKSVKTDLSLVLNMFSFQSHFVCAKTKHNIIPTDLSLLLYYYVFFR